MDRRQFLKTTVSSTILPSLAHVAENADSTHQTDHAAACCITYPSPQAAMKADPETLLYVTAIQTDPAKPDYLAVVDLDPESPTYSQITHRLAMPHPGDELHHFGWNICSSCHGQPGKMRQYLIVPGLVSGNIHVIDVMQPQPRMHKVISADEIATETNLSAPHTVHCTPDGKVVLSMLGDAKGNAPGGFLVLDEKFDIAGRWAKSTGPMNFNYDYWYQPRHNVMISTEWGAPNTVEQGFRPEDVEAGRYGHHIHVWDWTDRKHLQAVDLGPEGMIPLEIRFHHNPDSHHGFVGAALSSSMWHFYKGPRGWTTDKVIQVGPIEAEGWPFPVPGLITDLLLSLDDRWLYFSDWLHGDIRQYDVSDPAKPRLTAQVWLGGVLGRGKPFRGRKLPGGPQMLQLSLDGKRLYVTNSLYTPWDNQFYPDIAKQGSYLLQLDSDTDTGGLKVNDKFFVDFGNEPNGPARAHEMRLIGGDCTSDIWI